MPSDVDLTWLCTWYSPDNRYDMLYLANLAILQWMEEKKIEGGTGRKTVELG